MACSSTRALVLIRDIHSNNLIDTLLPEHTFTPRVPFAKSAISKEMTKSLHLTRHSAITRLSPMAHFMFNKGSSSDWEIAVKNRSDEVPDDMPVGWRIVEKKEDAPAPVETKKRSGLFSSFWNRREGSTTSLPGTPDPNTSLVQKSPTESSPTKPVSIAGRMGTPPIIRSRTASQSPRQSAEGRRSQSVSNNRLTKPPPVPPVVTASVSASPANSASPIPSIGQSPGDIIASPVESTTATDGQSAVSRFLNRFSRPKSTASHNSLSLSSEDLDFLSDVPVVGSSKNVGDEDDDMPLGKQKAMMESKQGAVLGTPLTATPLGVGIPSPLPPQTIAEDDFDALFNTPVAQPQRTPLQTPTRPSSSVSQTRPFRPHSTTQTDPPRSRTNSLRPQTPSFPIVRMVSTPSTSSSGAVPFLIPPPPSSASRPTTPGPQIGTLLPPITTSVPVLQLPPTSQKPTKTNLFDDDEFSDFLSSPTKQLPATNGTYQPKTLSFSGPIESMNSLNPIALSTSQQPVLQTANSSSSLMVSPVSDTVDDAWGFGDFEEPAPAASTATNSNHAPSVAGTPPTKTTLSPFSASQQWLSKPSPPPPPVPSKSGSSTPSSLTSSPLGPPPKSQFVSKQRPPPFNFQGPDQQPSPRSHSRRVSAEDHSHTIKLMNNASRRGAWPAPLSPLPEALAPPPPPFSTINTSVTAAGTSKALLDVGEVGGPFLRAQEKHRPLKTVSVVGPSENGGGMSFSNTGARGNGGLFALPPPPGSVSRHNPAPPQPGQEQSLLEFGDFESPKTAQLSKPTPLMAGKSGGGLSAQDLSFFEGL